MDQKCIPLYEELNNFKRSNPISYHVPGHKNGLLYKEFNTEWAKFLQYDVTELKGLDDLHAPDGPIKYAQELLSSFYKTQKSYFLVNGSTVGNVASILSSFDTNDYVLVQRNCHKSVLNALSIANVNPIFLSPKVDKDLSIPTEIEPSMVRKAFENFPTLRGCILTYPNYYGFTYNLKEIIEIVHENNGLVIVDEAHGPHFQLGNPLPDSAIKLGADIIIQSAHKMLPAMTMGSYLHINSQLVSTERMEHYLGMLQSSSPSYPIMMSLDIARHYIANFTKEDLEYTLSKRAYFISELSKIEGLSIHTKSGQDPLKIIVSYDGYSGFEYQDILNEQGVYPEFADQYHVVFVFPLLKKNIHYPIDDTVGRMKASCKLRTHKSCIKRNGFTYNRGFTQLSLSYEEMKGKQTQWVEICEAPNRIAAKMITPYPPGIPLILPGEKITEEQMEMLSKLIKLNAKIQGDLSRIREGLISVYID
ncbi:aminotransferase class I/II-fold pyridoxal phosphate-dependent enzyme [Bacillus sp. FJAT-49736]|uniref:aminotransferase class I/II-fold pyridoxal phosphate-dependent enzyme n=1 Tax=Bacillus sp. FJAT-49736 TaxID=2833582 RepID=UPI001BC8CF64|nr:aminotransferase class I/II-fold pyridoxal phosphate-dependent enzyme [Bacillus sp. FJAT-49736]MBS4175796.1 aminotransferase class I/II-fold pyridoxal phosphate-dependent enzyme [Bacillus sp. FJAT-49736]MBS4175878.1 aminotransferase class I/II-fold pyridoxal phosphate-dependent enzyme [Bacillus sp. FJAT-49736]